MEAKMLIPVQEFHQLWHRQENILLYHLLTASEEENRGSLIRSTTTQRKYSIGRQRICTYWKIKNLKIYIHLFHKVPPSTSEHFGGQQSKFLQDCTLQSLRTALSLKRFGNSELRPPSDSNHKQKENTPNIHRFMVSPSILELYPLAKVAFPL